MPIHELIEQIIKRFDDAALKPGCDMLTMTKDFYETYLRPVLKIAAERDTPVHPMRVGFTWHCGKCHLPIQVRGRDRCPHCGQALTWEEADDE